MQSHFTDNVLLLQESWANMWHPTSKLEQKCRSLDWSLMQKKKQKWWMSVGTKAQVGYTGKWSKQYRYWGVLLPWQHHEKDRQGEQCIWQLEKVWYCKSVSVKVKIRLYESPVPSLLLYYAQGWPMWKTVTKKLPMKELTEKLRDTWHCWI